MREANTLCEFYEGRTGAIDQVQIKLGTGDTGMANIGLALHKQEPITEWKNLQRYLCLIHFDPYQMCRSEIYSKAPEYKNHSQYQKILTGKVNYTGIQAAICWTEGNAGALPKRILEIAKAKKEVGLADTAWSLAGKMKGNVLQFSVQSGSGKVQLDTK